MSSNYPPGVDDNIHGTPFNDEQFCAEIVVKMLIPFTLLGPITKSRMQESMEEGMNDVIEQMEDALQLLEIEDVEIISKKVTKC